MLFIFLRRLLIQICHAVLNQKQQDTATRNTLGRKPRAV